MIAVFRIFILFVLVFVFTSCRGVESGRESDPRYRDGRREGNLDEDMWEDDDEMITDSPETITDKLKNQLVNLYSSMKECKSSTAGVPRNTIDIVGNILGKTLPTTQARECLVQNLEKASDRICESQRKLDEHLRKYDNYDYRRDRILSAINRVRVMEYNYKDRLYDLADKMRNIADKNKKGGWTGFFVEEEAIAYESIFEEEANTDCFAYFNYDSRNNSSSSSRRRY